MTWKPAPFLKLYPCPECNDKWQPDCHENLTSVLISANENQIEKSVPNTTSVVGGNIFSPRQDSQNADWMSYRLSTGDSFGSECFKKLTTDLVIHA